MHSHSNEYDKREACGMKCKDGRKFGVKKGKIIKIGKTIYLNCCNLSNHKQNRFPLFSS
jgi:hypothetical protein